MAEQNLVGLTPNRPAPDDWVEIEHDGVEATTRVHPRSLKHWNERGWFVVERDVEAPVTPEQEGAEPAPAVEADPEPTPTTTRKPARAAAPGTET